ncbi:hypothetical protein C8F04DRAFT_1268385 [Mycena alexandri]|uniref:Endonuclease/exonuclease/phosphatase domain-containing protein n=1 Tax=Mycena alexandri TaxID=1745969 RepID=A0AAD6WV09_9AGAR|nr:hypothetical protein C8F04DRAFT_1268385 [Mycena alexandri]
MRGFRARRGPDSNTVIACFESAEIAAWFTTAFNAARGAPTNPFEFPRQILGRRRHDSNSVRVPSKAREDLSGPDFMALQIGNIILYNTYLLPESANWAGTLESDPCLALASSLAVARAGNFEILLKGDLNARTGSNTPSANDPIRRSKDNTISTRGGYLFRLCNDCDLVFISRAECFGPNGGDYTSFQGSRQTVIDYPI